MMDYYKILGINKNASKSEIKQAFRNLALQFHPDKHTSSPKSVKDNATVKFKQLSEAYDVLSDDRKRADYNFRYSNNQRGFGSGQGYSGYQNTNAANSNSGGYGYGYSGGYQNRNPNGDSYSYYYSNYSKGADDMGHRVSYKFPSFAFVTTRAFLLNAVFIGYVFTVLFIYLISVTLCLFYLVLLYIFINYANMLDKYIIVPDDISNS